MQSIFDDTAYAALKIRLNQLNEDSKPEWGKMSVGQMVWHCQAPLNIMLQKVDYGLKSNWLAKLFFKKALYNDKPWRKGLPTVKSFKAKENKDFNTEKEKLEALMVEAYSKKDEQELKPHPAFGYFTPQQWGQMQYKHLDHHFRQFGV